MIPEDFVCFRFGVGKCLALSNVSKLDKYARLIKFANASNMLALYKQYQMDAIPEETATDSKLDGVPIERHDVLKELDVAPVEFKDLKL